MGFRWSHDWHPRDLSVAFLVWFAKQSRREFKSQTVY
jgi:hypothetical protein